MTVYRAALIGVGDIATKHVEAVRHMGARIDLLAAVARHDDRVRAFCAKHDIPASYTDTTAMLETERPDLVLIATPPHAHYPLIMQALESGAHVLCEKPLCASLAEFDAIAATEARTGCAVSTVFQWRFGSGAQHLKRLIDTGELGRALVGVCQTLWYRDAVYYAVPWRGKWATEIGGTTVSHGIHLMDLFLWLMGGDWTEVYAMIGSEGRDVEVDTVSTALVRFAGGALGTITNSVLSPHQESYLRLDFQRATVELRALYFAQNTDWRYSIADGAPYSADLARWQQIAGDQAGNHAAQLAHLLDSLDRGAAPAVSGQEARRILEFVASLYKAALTGQPVARGSITAGDPFYHAMHGAPTG